MTRAIADLLGQRGRISDALHVAIGAMVAHDTAHGRQAFDEIDVERLFAAVRMLASRDELEIAPFVAAWNHQLERVARSDGLPSYWGRTFKDALERPDLLGTELTRTFEAGVRELTAAPDISAVFSSLQREMVTALRGALAVDPGSVDYLAPILNSTDGPARIATLNYDESVELLADRAKMELDTGIRQWTGGYDWSWSPAAEVRLLKLHGSLNWRLSRAGHPKRMLQDAITLGSERDAEGGDLAVVFGQGAKLRSNGPFLAMLVEFEHMLEACDRLIVVGYSFRDEHINAAIRRWFGRHPNPRLSVVNPAVGAWLTGRTGPEFFEELKSPLGGYPFHLAEGHHLLASGAGQGLLEVLGPGPRLSLVPGAEAADGESPGDAKGA